MYYTTITISIKPIRFRKAMNVKLSSRKKMHPVLSQIMRNSILLFTISTNESNLFIIEYMFNWAHINLFTFLSPTYGVTSTLGYSVCL